MKWSHKQHSRYPISTFGAHSTLNASQSSLWQCISFTSTYNHPAQWLLTADALLDHTYSWELCIYGSNSGTFYFTPFLIYETHSSHQLSSSRHTKSGQWSTLSVIDTTEALNTWRWQEDANLGSWLVWISQHSKWRTNYTSLKQEKLNQIGKLIICSQTV